MPVDKTPACNYPAAKIGGLVFTKYTLDQSSNNRNLTPWLFADLSRLASYLIVDPRPVVMFNIRRSTVRAQVLHRSIDVTGTGQDLNAVRPLPKIHAR